MHSLYLFLDGSIVRTSFGYKFRTSTSQEKNSKIIHQVIIMDRFQLSKIYSGSINLYILVIDPGKQTEIVRVPDMGPQETTEAIVAAKEAYKSWSKIPARVLTQLLI